VIFTLFVLWCHMSKSCRFRLQEWWPQTFYLANVSVLSSCVNNGRVLLGECAVFIICIKYINGLLNVLVRNALALEKICPSHCHMVPTFRIMQLVLVYWSQNLWTLLPAVTYPVFKLAILRTRHLVTASLWRNSNWLTCTVCCGLASKSIHDSLRNLFKKLSPPSPPPPVFSFCHERQIPIISCHCLYFEAVYPVWLRRAATNSSFSLSVFLSFPSSSLINAQ